MDGRPERRKAPQRAPARARTTRKPARAGIPTTPEDALRAAITELLGPDAAASGQVVELMSRRALVVAARGLLHEHVDRCTKCGSTFVTHEPAFVHCHYCGRMHRVANASLAAQELFELRLGLRLAS